MSKYQDSSIENVQNLSISCNRVPDALLDKQVAKTYFQQYGKVLRIRLRPKHKMVIVEFANDESAQTAYSESGKFQGQDFTVSWTKNKTNNKKKVRRKLEDPNWSDDPDIKNELEAMKGNFTPNKNLNLRPEVMVTENTPKKMPVQKLSKPRQWKAEKTTKTKNTESMSDQENDLLKTIMASASSNEEKFRILDARDKLIRSRTVRQSELARVLRTIGTCPDMCPEKERLMREVQHQVAAYEQQAGSSQKNIMNHKLAVKQYSRSSADQESPLAHELRPVDVLQLTMGYLLHRIMDLCETPEVNLAEWYHFVWDRTRGIRKDVTQQELCCEKSVQLVEQCARFHVHCATRLVAEDVSVFDEKINTENLTKCLQTLKYMYHDLNVKHNICCKNEAEFRAYIVLLNLNDGNFMWEVQHLSPEIQRSHQIRFALSVYSALDKNNYVSFFKLIKSTSYLNACILLRYFNQVRFRALLTIVKSYSPRLPYPVIDLCQMLAFEDIPSTITFLEYHGLQLNVEKSHVHLDRNRFQQPDTPFALDRAINIVESKRNTTVGEIVCGENLPSRCFESHLPHNSFDEKGYLKASELPKDFQYKYQQFLKQFSEPEQQNNQTDKSVEEPKKSFSFTNQTIFPPKPDKTKTGGFVFKLPTNTTTSITTTTSTITTSIITATTTAKAVATTQDISEPDGEIQSFFNSIKKTRNESPLMILKNETSRSQSPLLLQQQSEKVSNTFWKKSTTTTKSIFGNTELKINFKPLVPPVAPTQVIDFQTKEQTNEAETKLQLPTATYNEEEEVLKEKLIEEELIKQKLIEEELLQKQNEEQERKVRKLLEEKQEIKKQEQLKQKQETERRKQTELLYEKELKHQIQVVVEEVLNKIEENLIKNRLEQISENIKMRKVLQYGRRWKNLTKISKKKRKHFFDNPVWVSAKSVNQEAEELFTLSQDLTLHDIKRYKYGFSNHIALKPNRNIEKLDVYRIVWKKLFKQLSISESMNFDIFWKIGLSLPENETDKLLKLLYTCLELKSTETLILKRTKCNNGGSLNVCIKKIQQNENSNGIIFFNFDREISSVNQERFQKIIYNKKQTNAPFPIVVLNKQTFEPTTIIQQLKLENLLSNQVILKYEIFQYTDNNFDEILTKTLEFFAENYREHRNKLEAHDFPTILRNCLGDEFWHRIRSSIELNTRFSIFLQSPNNVIDLYNEALKYLTKILFKTKNYTVPSLPIEFKSLVDEEVLFPCSYEYFPEYWKSPSYLSKLKKIMKNFHLPNIEGEWPPESPAHFQQILENYCRNVFQKNPENIVYKIISVVYRKYQDFCVSWVDILEIIILAIIDETQFNDSKHPVFTIVYDVDEMRDYRRIPWWFQLKFIQKGIKQIKYEYDNDPEPVILMEVSINDDSINLDETLNEIYKKQTNEENKRIVDEYKELNMLLEDLEKSMEIQKCIMKKFEEKALMALS